MLTVYILLPIIMNSISADDKLYMPSGVHVNKPFLIICKRTSRRAKALRLEHNGFMLGVLIYEEDKLHPGVVPKNGEMLKSHNTVSFNVNKSACFNAGNYTCMDLSDGEFYLPKVTKALGVYDLHLNVTLDQVKFPGDTECIDEACKKCDSRTQVYLSNDYEIPVRCKTYIPNMISIKSAIVWSGALADDVYFSRSPYRHRYVKFPKKHYNYEYIGCARNVPFSETGTFNAKYQITTNVNWGCHVKLWLDEIPILMLNAQKSVCVVRGTLYDTPELVILSNGVLKDHATSVACKRRHRRPYSLLLLKDKKTLVKQSTYERKIVFKKIPFYGYKLRYSTNSFKLDIYNSSCRDAGYYTCIYENMGGLFLSNDTKYLRVIDTVTKPVISHSGRSSCNSLECQRCAINTRAYVKANEKLVLTCSWMSPEWDVTASLSWIKTELWKKNQTLPTNIPNVTPPNVSPKKGFSDCIPNIMKTSRSRYQSNEQNTINVNIICAVKYDIKGISLTKTYEKLPVCVIAVRKTSTQQSSTSSLQTTVTTTSLKTTVTTTSLQTIATTITAVVEKKPTPQPFLSTTGKPESFSAGMIAALVVGIIAALGLMATILFCVVEKMIESKFQADDRDSLRSQSMFDVSEAGRQSRLDFLERNRRQSELDFSETNRRHSGLYSSGRNRRHSGLNSSGRNRRLSGLDSTGRNRRLSGLNSSGRNRRLSGLDSTGRKRRLSWLDSSGRNRRHSRSDFSSRTSNAGLSSRSSNFDASDISDYYEN